MVADASYLCTQSTNYTSSCARTRSLLPTSRLASTATVVLRSRIPWHRARLGNKQKLGQSEDQVTPSNNYIPQVSFCRACRHAVPPQEVCQVE